jgi:glycosyltransferase involved in cell wall biosynthesis
MKKKIFIFDSHPIQYKAPVYQEIERLHPGLIKVIYATDASVKSGNVDQGFGVEVKWDTQLLVNHEFQVLGNENGKPFSGPASLTGRGVFDLLQRERPGAVVLTQARYRFDHAAYLSALLLRIPILIRQETQDEMYADGRGLLKAVARYVFYRAMYAPVRHAFSFGALNRQHLLRHGFKPRQLTTAHFSVANPLRDMMEHEKAEIRKRWRENAGIPENATVVAFFGKLIPKKNPGLIFAAARDVHPDIRSGMHLLFVGSGELEVPLRAEAARLKAEHGVPTSFAGFVNQRGLPACYLAADIVVLPSRRMGEAWGLVINEALNAGCAVVMSDAVGCQHEFGSWERARVIREGSASALARALEDLGKYTRSVDWAEPGMREYSTEAAARSIGAVLATYST